MRFAVVGDEIVRRRARKLGRLFFMVVLQVAAQEQSVVAVSSDLVIKLENIGVVLGGIVAREGEATAEFRPSPSPLVALAAGGAVGQGIL